MPTEVAQAIRLSAEARRRSDVRRPTMALAVGIAAPRQKPTLARTATSCQTDCTKKAGTYRTPASAVAATRTRR